MTTQVERRDWEWNLEVVVRSLFFEFINKEN
jgi:hypothetical protein